MASERSWTLCLSGDAPFVSVSPTFITETPTRAMKPPPAFKLRDPAAQKKKWAAIKAYQAHEARIAVANLRVRAAQSIGLGDPLTDPIRSVSFGVPSNANSQLSAVDQKRHRVSPSNMKFKLKKDDLMRKQLTRWWEMVARSSGAPTVDDHTVVITFALYIELQLRLYKVLAPPPFDPVAAREAAEAAWQVDCPRGNRSLTRHLLENSLFEFADQKCSSTTIEELHAFLDNMFKCVSAGIPSSLKPLEEVQHRDVCGEAASIAAAVIAKTSKQAAVAREKAKKCLGDYGVLQLKGSPPPPTADTFLAAPDPPASPPLPFAFDSKAHLPRLSPLTSADTGATNAWTWGERAAAFTPPIAARKTPRLARTMSPDKSAPLSGAPVAAEPPRPHTVSFGRTVGATTSGPVASPSPPTTSSKRPSPRPVSQPARYKVAEWAAAAAGRPFSRSDGTSTLPPRSPRQYRSPRFLDVYRDAQPSVQSPGIGHPRRPRSLPFAKGKVVVAPPPPAAESAVEAAKKEAAKAKSLLNYEKAAPTAVVAEPAPQRGLYLDEAYAIVEAV